jgi:uncharacterized protein (UPF0335 family)
MMSLGHNTMDGKKLLGFIERIERLKAQQKAIGADIKVIKSEAEREGFSAKGVTVSLQARALKPSQFREAEDLRDLYLHAIGMAAPPPLFKMLESMTSDAMGKNEVIERFKELVPTGASIIVEMDGPPIRLFRDKDGKAQAEEVKPAKARGASASSAGAVLPEREDAEVPKCTPAEAEKLGADAFDADQPITANPFPFGDKRQPKWDAGWRAKSGSDGMGPDDKRRED